MTTQQILQGVHDWTNGKIVYDISVAHPDGQGNPTPYVDLASALGTNGGNIPEGLRKGGMSVKFIQGTVQSSDNKYVQYRLMSDIFNTTPANWQGVDTEIIAGSKNLAESGAVDLKLNGRTIKNATDTISLGQNTTITSNIGGAKTFVLKVTPTNSSITSWVPIPIMALVNSSWQRIGTIGNTSYQTYTTPENTSTVVLSPAAGFVTMEALVFASIIKSEDVSLYTLMEVEKEKDRAVSAENTNARSIDNGLNGIIGFNNTISTSGSQSHYIYGELHKGDSFSLRITPATTVSKKIQVYGKISTNFVFLVNTFTDGNELVYTLKQDIDELYITASASMPSVDIEVVIRLFSNPSGYTKLNKQSNNAEYEKLVEKGYTNILDTNKLIDGAGYNSGGQIMENSSWAGTYGAIILEWGNADKITVNGLAAAQSSGFFCCQFDENKVFITGSSQDGLTGTKTITRKAGAEYLGITVNPSANELRAFYGEELFPYDGEPNPINGYLKNVNRNIQAIKSNIDGSVLKLYAYAEGDTADDNTHFYGWKNGKCAIQRAIDSCDGITLTKIYCKGVLNITSTDEFTLQEDNLYNVIFVRHDKNNIELIGEGADKTVINVSMPANFANVSTYQPVGLWGNNIKVSGMSIYGKNCRYCIHLDASQNTLANGHKITIQDVVMRHYANDSGAFEAPFGLGMSDGMILKTINCKFVTERSYTPPLYVHDNKLFNEGFEWIIENCQMIPEFGISGTTQDQNVNAAVHLLTVQSKGSGVDGYVILNGNDIGMCKPLIINQQENITPKSDLKDYSPKIYIGVRGYSDSPIGYETQPLSSSSKPAVLRITSKTTGSSSSVRFDETSSAFDIIVKGLLNTGYTDIYGVVHTNGYQYRDGIGELKGYAMGELALDTGRMCSIQNRLGDCSSSAKSLVVTVDGTDYTINFNQDYTNYSDANMLAVFTNVLSSVADVELYNWGADYFPEIEPSFTILKNNTNTIIYRGMGVHIMGDGVHKATSDAEVDAIALDDILPNYKGRCGKKVMLSIFEANRFHVALEAYPQSDNAKYTSSYAADFGIGTTSGVFKKTTGGILKFKYYGYLILDK